GRVPVERTPRALPRHAARSARIVVAPVAGSRASTPPPPRPTTVLFSRRSARPRRPRSLPPSSVFRARLSGVPHAPLCCPDAVRFSSQTVRARPDRQMGRQRVAGGPTAGGVSGRRRLLRRASALPDARRVGLRPARNDLRPRRQGERLVAPAW